MTNFEQILRNPPLLKNPNIGGIDYPLWLSQLREAISKLVPKEQEESELEHSCEICTCSECEKSGRNEAINQINQALDKQFNQED